MTTKITADNIAQTTLDNLGSGPIIANVQIANSSYSVLDDTAVSTDGGYIVINGSKFESNVNVLIDGTTATSVTYVSENQIRAQVGAATAGSKIVYLVNTDTGATAIRINGLTYSGVPSWSTDSALTEGAVDEAISIQLDATADSNVSYQLQTGSTLPTGLTLAANGLLSGAVTGISEDTLYNFTIEAVDAENQDSPRAFSITITAGDANINSVVLALNADRNTFITDASTNSSTITPNGDTRPSAFSPYNTSWSNYFDTGATRLTLSDTSSISGVGANNFSIECWVYALRRTNTFVQGLVSYGTAGSTTGSQYLSVEINGSGYLGVAYATGASLALIDPNLFLINQWVHVVVCRSGSTLSLFINGTRVATTTTSSTVGSTGSTLVIGGQWYANADTRQINGYMSDVRIVNGSSAYDATQSSLTVPTTPLTAITNTSLLTCQSNRLIDNSTNNFAITRDGNVKVTSFGPFAETDATTGSGYFDGTGDYLRTTSTLGVASNEFTIGFWFYPLSSSVIGLFDSGPGVANCFRNFAGNVISDQNTTPSVSFAGAYTVNAWNWMCITKSGTSFTVYINGASVGTGTCSNPMAESNFTIGGINSGGDGSYNGYVSNFIFVNNSASEISVPPSPLTAISGTSLLTLQNRISYNNSQPVDESGVKNIVTRVGNASVGSYTPHTPAGWSAYFDGTGDYLSNNGASGQFAFGTGNFTVEFWLYALSVTARQGLYTNNTSASGTGPVFAIRGIGTTGVLGVGNVGLPDAVQTGSNAISANTWHHVALVREGTGTDQTKIYVDGVQQAVGTYADNFSVSREAQIGSTVHYGEPFNGYLSNVRIVKGTAVYTAAFTPPTTPLEPIANTSLLTLRGPSFTDDGPNRFAITRNGDTRITPFSPFKTHTIVPDSHSVYFDGTGDFLIMPYSQDFNFGTGDFTVECWANISYVEFTAIITSTNTSIATSSWLLGYSNTPNEMAFGINSSGVAIVGADYTSYLNTWTHIAACRSGTTLRLFFNGTQVASVTNSTSFTGDTTNPVVMGRRYTNSTNYPLNGYISNLRIVKGTAVYTSAFTPPTAPVTAISGTSLLTCQSSTVIDNSNNAFAITVNGNAQPSKYNPFGETITEGVQYSPASHGGSYYFDGTGDCYTLSTNEAMNFGTSDFTISAWIFTGDKSISGGASRAIIGNAGNSYTMQLYIDTVNGRITFGNTGSTFIQGTTSVSTNQWYHVVISRSGTSIKMFINGVLEASGTNSLNYSSSTIYIGSFDTSQGIWNGYISNLHIVKGTAVYTSAFVPPAAPPSPVAGTTLLLNGTNAAIADGVGKNVLETVGNARIINGTKKYGTGSMYFDGTGDGLLVKNTSIQSFGTGDFTIECWMNTTATGGIVDLFGQLVTGSSAPALVRNTTTLYWQTNYGVANLMSAAASGLFDGNWHHVAMVRYNGVSRVYLDGTSIMNANDTTNYASVGDIGVGAIGATYADYLGYIDDFRISKGVARYTSNFTPPTSSFKLK